MVQAVLDLHDALEKEAPEHDLLDVLPDGLVPFKNTGVSGTSCPACSLPLSFSDPVLQPDGNSYTQASHCGRCRSSFVDRFEHVSRYRVVGSDLHEDLRGSTDAD